MLIVLGPVASITAGGARMAACAAGSAASRRKAHAGAQRYRAKLMGRMRLKIQPGPVVPEVSDYINHRTHRVALTAEEAKRGNLLAGPDSYPEVALSVG